MRLNDEERSETVVLNHRRPAHQYLILCVCVFDGTGTCGVAIDCPQGRMQNVNTHLRWGGGQEGRGLDEQVMGWTDGGAGRGGAEG